MDRCGLQLCCQQSSYHPDMHPALVISLAVLPVLVPASGPAAGEKLPKGPPWFTEYRHAKRHALRTGTPVFVYFTKTV